MAIEVDVIQLTRDDSPLRADVRSALENQAGVVVHFHRVIGTARPGDANRWETIARARNEGKRRGSSPWVMFVDDDVILGPGCIGGLVRALAARSEFAALAADYNGEMKAGRGNWDYPGHVGMGATLFRRERLQAITFRWEEDKCECQCCCDDLRRACYGIGYLPGAVALHKPAAAALLPRTSSERTCADKSSPRPGRILTAFDRRHLSKFRRQFLPTLRSSGNLEPVTAVAYGLRPAEIRQLSRMRDVEVAALPNNELVPSIRRILDFQRVLAGWHEETPVAIWDAGDVFFQDRVQGLWDLVRAHPEELLIVQEPISHPENAAVVNWTMAISDAESGQRAFEVLSRHPFLNSGFMAGRARTLLHYFREAERLLDSSHLLSIGHGADQVAMNLYCHTSLGRWRTIPEGWNYCLFGRDTGEYRVRRNGSVESTNGSPVHVAHGNGGTLAHVGWYYKSPSFTLAGRNP